MNPTLALSSDNDVYLGVCLDKRFFFVKKVRIKIFLIIRRIQMVRMLVTINISKGWKTWSEMAKSLEPQMNEQGAKMIWAGANPDETAVFVLAEAKDPSFVKTFGERPDIVEIREAGGADVSSTTVMTQIGEYLLG